MTLEQIARFHRCSVDQLRAQYRKNAAQLRDCEHAAPESGKYRGYTRQQWRAFAERAETLAERKE